MHRDITVLFKKFLAGCVLGIAFSIPVPSPIPRQVDEQRYTTRRMSKIYLELPTPKTRLPLVNTFYLILNTLLIIIFSLSLLFSVSTKLWPNFLKFYCHVKRPFESYSNFLFCNSECMNVYGIFFSDQYALLEIQRFICLYAEVII